MRGQQAGFTLVEILTAISVIGILAGIAIPQYSAYRANGFDKRAWADLANVALAEEAHYSDNDAYISCDHDTCPTVLDGLGPLSNGVVLNVVVSGDSFTATATHPQGTGRVYTWTQ